MDVAGVIVLIIFCLLGATALFAVGYWLFADHRDYDEMDETPKEASEAPSGEAAERAQRGV